MTEVLRSLETLLSEPMNSVKEREATDFMRALERCDGQLVLFGAGNLGRRIQSVLKTAGILPIAFGDNRTALSGTRIGGVPVLSAAEASERYGKSALFVVTIWSPGHRYADTRDQLLGLGCEHVMCATRLRWGFADQLLPDYCQDLPSVVYQHASGILAAGALMSDEFSQQEYLRQVRWRALGDFGELSAPQPDQYFPRGLFDLKPKEVFIDCGAYNGITVQRFVQKAPDFAKIFAIDADPSNFDQLRRCISSMPQKDRIHAVRLAVGEEHTTVRFSGTGTVQAAICSDGDIEVEQVRLDDLLAGERPTYIKMDIEGAEYGALAGGKEILGESQPLLAVCLYHTPIDFWRIPLRMHELVPKHSLHIRPHVEDGWDLVCYAVPPGRLLS